MNTPPTFEEIETWRNRGFDIETIRHAKKRRQLFEEGLLLLPMIERAFQDVTLGDGIGRLEAVALDDHKDAGTCAKMRMRDKQKDWRKIQGESLQGVPFFFFDPEGVRFHLPAFMCANLKGEIDTCFMSMFTAQYSDIAERKNRLSKLNEEQHDALRSYMIFLLKDPYEDGPAIENALNELWT